MIKQLLSIAFIAGTFAVSAQTNLDFETWASGAPTGWDAPVAAFVPGSVSQVTSGAGQGSSSVKLTTGNCAICPAFGLPGVMPGFIVQSVASTVRPTSIDFLVQANIMANDEAMFMAQLTKWNGSATDVIGQGGGTIPGGTSISAWTPQTAPFTYVDPGTPDSLTIIGISSDSLVLTGATSNPTVGSTISLDAIVITNPVGIQDIIFVGAKHIAYPNPASSEITFASNDDKAAFVAVYDLTGREVANMALASGRVKMDLSTLESGMYIYSIKDASKAVLHTNKFNVAK